MGFHKHWPWSFLRWVWWDLLVQRATTLPFLESLQLFLRRLLTVLCQPSYSQHQSVPCAPFTPCSQACSSQRLPLSTRFCPPHWTSCLSRFPCCVFSALDRSWRRRVLSEQLLNVCVWELTYVGYRFVRQGTRFAVTGARQRSRQSALRPWVGRGEC